MHACQRKNLVQGVASARTHQPGENDKTLGLRMVAGRGGEAVRVGARAMKR